MKKDKGKNNRKMADFADFVVLIVVLVVAHEWLVYALYT